MSIFFKNRFFFLAYMSYIPIYKIISKTQIESCLVDIISKRWEKHIHGWIKWPNILSCTHNSNCIIQLWNIYGFAAMHKKVISSLASIPIRVFLDQALDIILDYNFHFFIARFLHSARK